jgi:DNA-binding beta-propeller fold protein YncE
MTAICVLATAGLAAAAPFAYVANSGTKNLSVIDTATDSIVGIPIALPDGYAYGVTVGASGQYVYVGMQDTNVISVIDAARKVQVRGIGLGTDIPGGLAVNAAETRLYVTSRMSNTLIIIDISNGGATEVGRVTVDDAPISNPEGVILSPAGNKAYVANSSTGKVAEITLDETHNVYTRTALTTVGAQPIGLAISSQEVSGSGTGYKLYVSSLNGDVKMVNTATKAVTALPVGTGTVTVAITPDNSKVYAPSNSLDKLYVIDAAANPNVVLGTQYAVAAGPYGSSVTPDGSKLYLTMNTTTAGETVKVFNTNSNTVTATVALPAGAKPTSVGKFIGPALPFTIEATNGTGCALSPVGTIAVNEIGRTFTVTDNPGPCRLVVDGNLIGISVPSYSFTNVTGNHTIDASPLQYHLLTADWTGIAGGYLVSTPQGTGPVGINASSKTTTILSGVNVTIKAGPGYKATSWSGDCAGTADGADCILLVNGPKTFAAVMAQGGGKAYNVTQQTYYPTCEAMTAAAANGDVLRVASTLTSCTTPRAAGAITATLSSQWLETDPNTPAGTYGPLTLTITDVAIIVATDTLVL